MNTWINEFFTDMITQVSSMNIPHQPFTSFGMSFFHPILGEISSVFCASKPHLDSSWLFCQWVFSNRRGYHFHKSGLHHQNTSFSEIFSKRNSKQQASNTNKNKCGNQNGAVLVKSSLSLHDQSHASGHRTNKVSLQLFGESTANPNCPSSKRQVQEFLLGELTPEFKKKEKQAMSHRFIAEIALSTGIQATPNCHFCNFCVYLYVLLWNGWCSQTNPTKQS